MEARIAGQQPISVSHQGPTFALAIGGGSNKLVRSLDRIFGKRQTSQRSDPKLNRDEAL